MFTFEATVPYTHVEYNTDVDNYRTVCMYVVYWKGESGGHNSTCTVACEFCLKSYQYRTRALLSSTCFYSFLVTAILGSVTRFNISN